nr:nuclease [Sulfolobus acidocaldarius]
MCIRDRRYWANSNFDGFEVPNEHLGREYLIYGLLHIKLKQWKEKGLIPDNIYLRRTGIGTLTSVINHDYYKDVLDKYDFTIYYHYKENGEDRYWPGLFIDTTGSSWTEEQSEQRYGEPIYAVLSTKVWVAQEFDVLGRTIFIHYNDREDKLKLIVALSILNLYGQNKIRLNEYEYGAKSQYYIIPVKFWKNITELRVIIKGYYQSFVEYLARVRCK